jgi:lipoprotein-releasing system permease protein
MLIVSGISQAQMSDFDMYYAFVDVKTMSLLTGVDGVQAIHCKLSDPFLADDVAERIERDLGLRVTTWYESQEVFFGALKQEKFAMFIILVFIILVAAFNITSTLIMVVMEKRRDIGILRTLGISGSGVLLIFMLEGLFIGLTGTFFGVIAGTLLAYNLNPVAGFIAGLFNIDLFNSQIYYFDRIPVAVIPFDILWITVSAIVLTFISTLYPAWSAARLDPVEALRYE